jgi:hypothetical protein
LVITMPSPSEEFSKQAYNEAKQGVVDAVADNLRAQRGVLIASGVITAPPEPYWNELADEAITKRSLNGIALDSFPPLGDGRSISDLIPTEQRIDLIAKDVSAGVKENTGSIGFLKGATIGQAFRGFFAMIQEKGFGAAISGIFNMIFGDGKSEDAQALTQSIAQVTGRDINKGVTERLKSHQQELGLSDEQVAQIGAQTENSVRGRTGLPPIDVPGTQQPPVGPGGMTEDQNLMVQNNIRTGVMQNFGLKQDGTQLVVDAANAEGAANLSNMAQAAGLPEGKFTNQQHHALVNTMTTALHSIATSNPPLRDPKEIQAQIKTQLANNADEIGLGNMSPANQDAMLTMMANKATAGYLDKRMNQQDKDAGKAFGEATAEQNQQLASQLAETRIRPEVIKGLGLEEKTPGQLTDAPVPENAKDPSQINLLQEVVGRNLNNNERTAIVDTVSHSLANLAANGTKDPQAISATIKADLEANAEKMGFGDLSKEDRGRLFTVMANKSTASYLETTAGKGAADTFKAATQSVTDQNMGELTNNVVRQKMYNELVPQTLQGVEDSVIASIEKRKNGLDEENIPEPIKSKLKERFETLLKEPNKKSPEGRAQILSFAAAMGGPNQAQREAMAKETSDAMVSVLMAEENKGKSPEELAPLMEKAVTERLEQKQAEIESLGGKFKMRTEKDNHIAAAGEAVKEQTKGMTLEQQADIAKAQAAIKHDAAISTAPLNFDVEHVTSYARTMTPVVDRNTAKETFRQDIRLQTQQVMMNILNQGVADSVIPGASTGLAINSGYAPNHRQMDFIADQVADVTSEIMADPSIPAGDKARRAKEAVIERLESQRDHIDTPGKDGGLANDKAHMLVMGLYKYSLTDKHLGMIADGVEKGINKRLGEPGQREQLEQLHVLAAPINIEAPTQTPASKPGQTQLAQR